MRGLKTLLVGLVLAFAGPMPALSADRWAERFASCAGRLSAQMEHQWLIVDARADQTRVQRGRMLELLETVTTTTNAVRLMSIRITAKYAHANLLRRATFNRDPKDSARARSLAARNLSACTGLMMADATEPRAAHPDPFRASASGPNKPKPAKSARNR